MGNPYNMAQHAICELKAAVYELLLTAPDDGLTNAQIGRSLGIYHGHIEHEGHISRVILEMLRIDGVAEQLESKHWRLKRHF